MQVAGALQTAGLAFGGGTPAPITAATEEFSAGGPATFTVGTD